MRGIFSTILNGERSTYGKIWLICFAFEWIIVNMIGLIWQVKIRSFLCLLSFVFLARSSAGLLGLEGR